MTEPPIDFGKELRELEAELGGDTKTVDILLDWALEVFDRFSARFEAERGRKPTYEEWMRYAEELMRQATDG